MFSFKNVSDVTYGAYVINGAYRGINNSNVSSTQAPVFNQDLAVIRRLLAGEIAPIRRSAAEVSTAVSAVQIFTNAIDTMAEKLDKMLELAKKALEPYQSQEQREEMQKQFQNFAEEINQAANSAEYKFNRPFTADGESFSIGTGNGSKIDIIAKDFRIDAQGLNIAVNPQDALSTVKKTITSVGEYKTYLDRKAARLGEITAIIESEIQSAMGIKIENFQPELATPVANYVASLISQDKQTSLNIQANLAPDETLNLLKINY